VVSDTLNYAQEIESHQAGLSVPRDPHLFADALVRLLTDQELRHKLGQNGFDLARMYSWETTGEKVERTIGSILWGEPLPADLTLEQG
jgi:glycosyltransferase involved in cell wall biosynthesis